MILNNETFRKVAEAAGYKCAQYQGVYPGGAVAFRVSDVPEPSPWEKDVAQMVQVNESLEIVKRYPAYCITEEGIYYYPEKEVNHEQPSEPL